MPASLRGGGLVGGAWALTGFYFDICDGDGGRKVWGVEDDYVVLEGDYVWFTGMETTVRD
jgi:hypothetical protein